jgi:hypothetical protein
VRRNPQNHFVKNAPAILRIKSLVPALNDSMATAVGTNNENREKKVNCHLLKNTTTDAIGKSSAKSGLN